MSLDMKSLMTLGGIPGFDGEVETVTYEPTILESVVSHPAERNKDLETDYSIVRETLNQQNQMMMAMAKIALENAKNSESPKVVEAFVKLMGAMTDNSKEILRVHREMESITKENTKVSAPETQQPSMNIENATVFMGTPTELMMQEGTQTQAQSLMEGEFENV